MINNFSGSPNRKLNSNAFSLGKYEGSHSDTAMNINYIRLVLKGEMVFTKNTKINPYKSRILRQRQIIKYLYE